MHEAFRRTRFETGCKSACDSDEYARDMSERHLPDGVAEIHRECGNTRDELVERLQHRVREAREPAVPLHVTDDEHGERGENQTAEEESELTRSERSFVRDARDRDERDVAHEVSPRRVHERAGEEAPPLAVEDARVGDERVAKARGRE